MEDLNKNHKNIRKNHVKRYIHQGFFFFFGTVFQALLQNNLLFFFYQFSHSYFSCLLLHPYHSLYLPCFHLRLELSQYSWAAFCLISLFAFLNVMMNGDFWDFLFYYDKLSIIKCKCARQVAIDLSRSSRRCP